MPTPLNENLYNEVKQKIMKSYKKNSAFASGAIVKEYKRLGGKYSEDGKTRNLSRWFKEKWIDVNPVLGITDDTAYPVFRPTIRINENTPALLQDIPVSVLKKQHGLKQKYRGEKNLPQFLTEIKGGMVVKKNPFNSDDIEY